MCAYFKSDITLFLFTCLCLAQIFARTEADTHVLAYSEGALVPCSVSADMTLAQATVELVKVRHVTVSKNQKLITVTNPYTVRISQLSLSF